MQAALILGTAAYGSYSQMKAGSEQRKLANKNADLIDNQATDALKRGEEEVLAVRRRTRLLKGQQRAAFATQGVDVGSGSALDLQNETDLMGAADEKTIQRNAWREAWGLNMSASNQRLGGKYAQREGNNKAIGSLLGGVGDAAPYFSAKTSPKVRG